MHYGSDREYDGRFTEQGKSLASGAKICGFPAETSVFLTKTAFSLVHSRRAPRKAGFASAATNITVAATDITVALVNITVPPANIAVPPVNTKVAPKNSTVVTTNITVVPRNIPAIATNITVVSQEHSGSHPGV